MIKEAIKEFRERKKPLDKIIEDHYISTHPQKKDEEFWNIIEKRDKLAEEMSRKYFLKLRWELQYMERRNNK